MNKLLLAAAFFLSSCAAPMQNSIQRIDVAIPPLMEGGYGTGFAINDHLVVTAGHVCMIALFGGEFTFGGSALVPIKVDLDKDLCLMLSDKPLTGWLPIATTPPEPGDDISVVGYPGGIPVTFVTYGQLAGTMIVDDELKLERYVLSCQSYGGNSGGPVLNSSGEVVGVLVAGLREYTQMSIAVTLADLRAFLDPK